MGFWGWLTNIFSPKEYDTKAALHFIKKNYEKYKIIDPEDRKEFEEMFGALAKEEIYRLKRYLEAEEINILAQRIRIRQFQLKEKEGKKIIGKKAGKEDIQEWSQQKTQLFIKIIREKITPSLSNLKKDLFSLYGNTEIETKLTELIQPWKTTLNLLQRTRIVGKNPEIIAILRIITKNTRKEFSHKFQNFIATATAHKARLEEMYAK